MTRAETHVLYRIFNDADDLLYVGITNNPSSRFSDHRGKPWWQWVAKITVEHHASREELREAEAAAIRDEHPWFNGLSATQIDDIVNFDADGNYFGEVFDAALSQMRIERAAGSELPQYLKRAAERLARA
ncbi:GIY-YIG nuclease family protein [Mycobacterium sp. C3-094]